MLKEVTVHSDSRGRERDSNPLVRETAKPDCQNPDARNSEASGCVLQFPTGRILSINGPCISLASAFIALNAVTNNPKISVDFVLVNNPIKARVCWREKYLFSM